MDQTEAEYHHSHYDHHHSNWPSRLFWGLVFILAGILAILSNFDVVQIHWDNLFKLWPMLIILIGLSFLSFHNIAWKIITTILILFFLAIISLVAIGYSPNTYLKFDSIERVVRVNTQAIEQDLQHTGQNIKSSIKN